MIRTIAIKRRSRFVPVILDSDEAEARTPCRHPGSLGGWGYAYRKGLSDAAIRSSARESHATYSTLLALRADYPDAERRRDLDI